MYTLIACVVLIFIVILFLTRRITTYTINSRGPVIGFLAGIHGNEPAGSVELLRLINSGFFNSVDGVVFKIIPAANLQSLRLGVRQITADMNRIFTTRNAITDFFSDCDIIIDFHEGYSWHLINNKSLGSTLTPSGYHAKTLADKIVSTLNSDIHDPAKKFTVQRELCDIPSSLGCFSERAGKNYILVETTGQRNIQPLSVRTKQVRTVILETIQYVLN